MTYAAKVICDSISPDGVRLISLEVTLPRLSLAELNTHRVFSRNSASSRAIPVAKRIQSVIENPYIPDEFGSNRPGMQSGDPLEGQAAELASEAWLRARDAAVAEARILANLGVHKEYANRVLEPFLWHTVLITSTEWANYFALRTDSKASRPIRLASELMVDAILDSSPAPLNYGEWHLPYVSPEEEFNILVDHGNRDVAIKASVARCARLSYLTQDGVRDLAKDLELYDRLLSSGHMSPFEHAARPATNTDRGKGDVEVGGHFEILDPGFSPNEVWFGNFCGWVQYRKMNPNEAVFMNGDAPLTWSSR